MLFGQVGVLRDVIRVGRLFRDVVQVSAGVQLCCLAEWCQVEVLFGWVGWLEMLFCGYVFWESGGWWEWVGLVAWFSNTPNIRDAMTDLLRLAQIKKHEKHPWTILL